MTEHRPARSLRLLKNPWDAVPAAMALGQFAYVIAVFVFWNHLSWPQRALAGLGWSFCIGWSLDSIAHNFIHNKFFFSEKLNIAMSFVISWTLGISQVMHEHIHWRHHAGNADYPDQQGQTIDPISVYKFGADRKAEPMISYVFLAFLRDDDPFTIAREIAVRRPGAATMARWEFWTLMAFWAVLLALNWQCVLFMAPFYYLGHCFSALIAYYEHLGANPEKPTATGVSTYEPIYNFIFLNNGYHAEHHFRPKRHWSEMETLRREMSLKGQLADTRTMKLPHFLGFLEPSCLRVPTAKKPKAAHALGS